MADNIEKVMKKRKTGLTASAKKRRKLYYNRQYKKTYINIKQELPRWEKLKENLGLLFNWDVAKYLLDRFDGFEKLHSSMEQTSMQMDTQDRELSGLEPLTESSSEQMSQETTRSAIVTRTRIAQHEKSDSFIDPFQVSIDVTFDEDLDLSCDDSDVEYEPSFSIGPIIPEEISMSVEDEDVEFSCDPNSDDSGSSESEDERQLLAPSLSKVTEKEHCKLLLQDDVCLVYVDQLRMLSTINVTSCLKCGKPISRQEKFIGSALYFSWHCTDNHVSQRWCSQPIFKYGLHAGDFQTCSTILLSGGNFGKMAHWAKILKLHFPHAKLFNRIQQNYMVPTIEEYWLDSQQTIVDELKEKELVLLGDGRNDSPGHSAQYCTYTFMEADSKKVVHVVTMDKRETDRKSGNMEKAAFQLGLDAIMEKRLNVKEIVTDAHLGITALMRSKYTYLKHSHDVWHAAKNLGKKIAKVSQKKGNAVLRDWSSHIVNHFWFSCREANGSYDNFVGIWRGVLHHVTNNHEWIIPHGNIGGCLHGPLEEHEVPWLDAAKDVNVLKDLASLVLDKRLLKKVEYYLNFRSTAELESFHQHILMYAGKRFAFTPTVYRVRNLLAVLDHNENASRNVLINKDGSTRLQRTWNKKSCRWSVQPVKEEKSYNFVNDLMWRALVTRVEDTKQLLKPKGLGENDPRKIAKHLAPTSPPETRLLAEKKKSRFQ